MKNTLTDLIKTYSNVLSPEICDNIIQLFERNKSQQYINGKSVSENFVDSEWKEVTLDNIITESALEQFEDIIYNYKEIYEQDCCIKPSLPKPVSFAPFMLKRYSHQLEHRFESHYDSIGPVSNRYLVFLWYLNTVEKGGETIFDDLDLSINPKQGTLLVFPPYWMFRHTALKPLSADKYILSTYLRW